MVRIVPLRFSDCCSSHAIRATQRLDLWVVALFLQKEFAGEPRGSNRDRLRDRQGCYQAGTNNPTSLNKHCCALSHL